MTRKQDVFSNNDNTEQLHELGPSRLPWRRPLNDTVIVTETKRGLQALKFRMELEWRGLWFLNTPRRFMSICDKRSFDDKFRCTDPEDLGAVDRIKIARTYPMVPQLSVDVVIIAFHQRRPVMASPVHHYHCMFPSFNFWKNYQSHRIYVVFG